MFKNYWQALIGFRRRAVLLVFLSGLSGLLEGAALLTLLPLLKKNESGEGLSGKFYQVAQGIGIPPDKVLYFSTGAFILMGLFSAFIRFMVEYGLLKQKVQMEQSFRKRMTTALFNMKWSSFLSMNMGDLTKGASQETSQCVSGILSFISALGAFSTATYFVLAAFIVSPQMTLYTLTFAGVVGLGYKFVGNRAFKYGINVSKGATSITAQVTEIFGNLKLLRATGFSPQGQERANAIYQNYGQSTFWSLILGQIMRFVFEGLGIIFLGGILIFSLFVFKQPFEQIIVFLVLFYRLVPRIRATHDGFYNARVMQPWYLSWKDRYEYILKHAEKHDGTFSVDFEKGIEVKNLSFRYPNREEDVLKDVDFFLKKGNCVALVGPSGSGKSTMIDLITCLLKPSKGQISVDGIFLDKLDVEKWRSKIGLVLQDSPVFHTTILENLAYGESNPDLNRIKYCIQLAHAEDFIENLSDGIHTIVGEKGGRLSGGQRQRIALARALYRNPSLLILDEATSALDGDSEIKIQEALESLKGKITILMVAHRIKTVQMADEILVFNQGSIVERGSWSKLMDRRDGVFRKMADLQGLSNQKIETEVS